MGFEIVGLQPEKEVGKSFSNNVWHWRPLWGYIAETCRDILSEEEIEQGTWNDGYEYSRTKAMKLARRLYELLKSGKVDEWGRQRRLEAMKHKHHISKPIKRLMKKWTPQTST